MAELKQLKNKSMKTTLISLAVIAILATPGPVFGAGKVKSMTMPDFTKGEKIPEGAKHDWNLGATGVRGWMYCDKMVTSDARQIAITKVDKGSPADGVLAVGDVILGVGGKPFSYDPRTEMGKALTLAESDAGKGNLTLTRWRAGSSAEVVVKIPVLGTYSATAPYNCPKSKRILEQGCKDLATRMADPSYAKRLNPIPRSLNALALLASGDPSYLPLIKKETEWAANFTTEAMATWYYGYIMMFLSEYKIATGDDSVMPGLNAARARSRPWSKRGGLVGPQVRSARRTTFRLRDDELPRRAAHLLDGDGAHGGRERSGLGSGDRTQCQAAAILHRQRLHPLRRSRPMDANSRGQWQVRHGLRSCSTCSARRKARSSSPA